LVVDVAKGGRDGNRPSAVYCGSPATACSNPTVRSECVESIDCLSQQKMSVGESV
jgi:hypothetical protein